MAVITKRRKAFSVIYHVIDKNGMDKAVWETFYDYKEAVKRKTEIENEEQCSMQFTCQTKILDFLNTYIYRIGLSIWSESRYESNIGIVNNYLRKVLGDNTIADINIEFAESLLSELEKLPAIGKRNQKKSEYMPYSMLYSCYTMLKGTFDYLVNEKLIKDNPFHTVTIPKCKPTNKIENNWNLEYVKLMFEYCDDQRLFIALHLLFGCGLNISELFGLCWNDIYFCGKNSYIVSDKIAKRYNLNTIQAMDQTRIIKQFKNEAFTETNTAFTLLYKETPRKIMIPQLLVPVIELWKDTQAKMFGMYSVKHKFVIDTETGIPYGERSFSKLFCLVKEKMKHKELTLVKLKNYGVQKDENGVSNAVKFYTENPQCLLFPGVKPKTHDKNGSQKIKNAEIKRKFDAYLPKDTSDLEALLEQIENDPKLKMKLIHKLQEELL